MNMNQWLKRLAAGLLVGIMIWNLSGCAKKDDVGADRIETENFEMQDVVAKGRYIETQLTAPGDNEGFRSMTMQEDGTLVIIDIRNGIIATSADDGVSWEEEEHKKLVELLMRGVEITSAVIAPDGSLFISYVPWEESTEDKTYPEKYVYLDKEGNETEFELGINDYKTSTAKAVFTKEQELFLLMNDCSIWKVDIAGQSMQKLPKMENHQTLNMFPYGDSIITLDGIKAYRYDTATGELDSSDAVLNEYLSEACVYPDTVVMGQAADGRIIAASDDGIYSHVWKGNVMEQLADGAITNLGDPSKTPYHLLVREDGSILILYLDGELDSYTYDPEASAVPEEQLTIYSLYENDTVRQAISNFRKSNQEVYVKMEIGITGEDGVTEEDAIQKLNTELLAGNGPDLILLDGMPLDSYVEKGILLDMKDLIQELKAQNQYYTNILEAYQTKEGIYAVPFRYYLPLIAGNTEMINGITDLTTLADTACEQAELSSTEETVLGTYTAEEVLQRLYPVCAGAWYQEDSVAKEALTQYLTQAKRIYEADQKNLDAEELESHKNMRRGEKDAAGFRMIEVSSQDGNDQIFTMLSKKQLMIAGSFKGMQDLMNLVSTNAYYGDTSYQSYHGQVQNVFIPAGIAGINAASGQQELARAFLKILLGIEVQGKDLRDGFPVNKDAFLKYSTNPTPDVFSCFGIDDNEGNHVMINLIWPTAEEISKFETLIEALENPAQINASINNEVVSIGAAALTGEKTIENSVEEIFQKLTLYLQE